MDKEIVGMFVIFSLWDDWSVSLSKNSIRMCTCVKALLCLKRRRSLYNHLCQIVHIRKLASSHREAIYPRINWWAHLLGDPGWFSALVGATVDGEDNSLNALHLTLSKACLSEHWRAFCFPHLYEVPPIGNLQDGSTVMIIQWQQKIMQRNGAKEQSRPGMWRNVVWTRLSSCTILAKNYGDTTILYSIHNNFKT